MHTSPQTGASYANDPNSSHHRVREWCPLVPWLQAATQSVQTLIVTSFPLLQMLACKQAKPSEHIQTVLHYTRPCVNTCVRALSKATSEAFKTFTQSPRFVFIWILLSATCLQRPSTHSNSRGRVQIYKRFVIYWKMAILTHSFYLKVNLKGDRWSGARMQTLLTSCDKRLKKMIIEMSFGKVMSKGKKKNNNNTNKIQKNIIIICFIIIVWVIRSDMTVVTALNN